MCVVCFCTFVKQGSIAFVVRAVAFIEVLRRCRHIDKGDTLLIGQLLHLVAIVVGVVALRNALVGLEYAIDDDIVFCSQVMTAYTGNGCSSVGKVAAADC